MRRTPAAARPAENIFKLAAIGRKRQLMQRPILQMAGERRKEPHDVLSHQRFAAGDADLPDAFRDERAAQPIELFERERPALGRNVMFSDMQ